MSDYFFQLPADVQERYLQKVSIIDHFDPYTFSDKDFLKNILDFPKISFMKIVTYFAITHSYYTGKQLEAYKSLEAHKFYEAGFIVKMNFVKKCGCFVVIGEVSYLYTFL